MTTKSRDDDIDWPSLVKPDTPQVPHRLHFVPVDITTSPNDPCLNLKQEYNRIQSIICTIDANNLSRPYSCAWGEVVKEVRTRKPLILHFSCHAETEAIKLFRRNVDVETMADALKAHNEISKRSGAAQVQLVVLNACSSDEHAKKLTEVVDFAIGHKDGLNDDDAIEFSDIFYSMLFHGKSLLEAMMGARGCSRGYRLYGRCDASAFRLGCPVSHCQSLRVQDWALEDFQDKTDKSVEELTEQLSSHRKKEFWCVVGVKVREMSERTARLCSPTADESGLAETDALIQSNTNVASDPADEHGQIELVVARNEREKGDLETHITQLLRDFRNFSENHTISVNDSKHMHTENDGKEAQPWTMCMLLWLKVMRDARLHEESREKLDKCISESASQNELLEVLEDIFRHRDVTCKYWDRAEFDAWGWKKKYASIIFLTDRIVSACLPDTESCKRAWIGHVMKDWEKNNERAGQILERMNRFLWSRVESIQIVTSLIETPSNVCYMIMDKITSLILFEYLDIYKRQKTAEAKKQNKSASSMTCLFHGFCLFISSTSKAFALQKIGGQKLRQIRSNLRILARLPSRFLLYMRPARRVEKLLEEEGRSILTAHQQEKARECEEAMEGRRGIHLQGPAGTGKTFMALHMMLRELEKDRICSILFMLRSEAFVFFIAHWVSSMMKWKLVDAGLFDRIFFSFRGETGWDGPFLITEKDDGCLRKKQEKVEMQSKDELEYKYVVIDEAHHVFCDEEATDFIRKKQYDMSTMLLMSDTSQADVTNIAYPQDLQDVYLTEVVRNSNRTMTASLLFHRGISKDEVSCPHKVDGRPVKPYIFAFTSEVELASEYIPHILQAMKDVIAEFSGDLDWNIAILAHEKLINQGLRQVLQNHLNQDEDFQSRFSLVAAVDAWKATQTSKHEQCKEKIVFDTVANFDGMESKIVIAVGLDMEEQDRDLNMHRSLLYRAITRTLKEGMVMIVNHRVKEGILSFLDGIEFEDKFDVEEEKKKINKTLCDHIEQMEREKSLPKQNDEGGRKKRRLRANHMMKTQVPHRTQSLSSSFPTSSNQDDPGSVAFHISPGAQAAEKTRPVQQIVQSVWDTRRHETGGSGFVAFEPYVRCSTGLHEEAVSNIEVVDIELKGDKLRQICVCCNRIKEKAGEEAGQEEGQKALFPCDSAPYKVLLLVDADEQSDLRLEKDRDLMRHRFIKGSHETGDAALIKFAKSVSFEYSCFRNMSAITRMVNLTDPVILHLTCHGSKEGNITIGGVSITAEQLSISLSLMVKNCTKLRLVVLNLSYSSTVAKELIKHVDFVIGHETAVAYEDTIDFSRHLYYWMGRNYTLHENVRAMSRNARVPESHLLARVSSHLITWKGRESINNHLPGNDRPTVKKMKIAFDATGNLAPTAKSPPKKHQSKSDHSLLMSQLEQAQTTQEMVNSLKAMNQFASKSQTTEQEITLIMRTMEKNINCMEVQHQTCIRLGIYAESNKKNRTIIAAKGGIEAIILAMKVHLASEALQQQACVALENLAEDDDNKVKLARLGGMETVIGAMKAHQTSEGVQEQALGALANLSMNEDNAAKLAVLGGMETVMRAMKAHPASGVVQEQACVALANLAVNADNAAKLAGLGGLETILGAMKAHRYSQGVQEQALGALANLAESADIAVKIAVLGGMEAIMRAMKVHPTSEVVQQYACWALANLAVNADNAAMLADLGGMEAIMGAMKAYQSSEALHEQACRALLNLASTFKTMSHMVVPHVRTCVRIAMETYQHNANIQEFGRHCLEMI